MDLQFAGPKGIPKSKSLATYEQWREHERQLRRSQSQKLLGGEEEGGEKLNPLEDHHRRASEGAAEAFRRQNGSASTSRTSSYSNLAQDSPRGKRSNSRKTSLQQDAATPLLDENGMIEYATLELRVHPPSVKIDNTLEDHSTVVIVDSANRPGTLVEVVERLTELGLGMRTAQISSDGGWFVDVFHVTNEEGEKIRDKRTLERIENILDLNFDISPGVPSEGKFGGMNVIEVLLKDEPGLLSRLSEQITRCQLNIYDTLLWTHGGYAAILFTASESGQPLSSERDQRELQSRLEEALGLWDIEDERLRTSSFVHVNCCHDTLYVEKRFYRLKMKASSIVEALILEDGAGWRPGGRGGEEEVVAVTSRFDAQTRYTTFHVKCRDRPQLLFDTVCTLSDLSLDIFHATIDADGTLANLEFFVKSRSGSEIRSEKEMKYVKERLRLALNLGAPPALCIQVTGRDHKGDLHRTTRRLQEVGLDIAYCTSRTDPIEMQTCSTFYVLDAKGRSQVEYSPLIEGCCRSLGAKCLSHSRGGLESSSNSETPSPSIASGHQAVRKSPRERVVDMGGDLYTLESALLNSWNRLWQGVD
mmetsp:Transcript_5236/g.15749  ORF Transcript_5236/g.15749 Transcript_5236/m.15749 type:complete len:589 (-) Transcript_5236:163-1929(-)